MLFIYRDEYRHLYSKKNMKCVILVIILSRKCVILPKILSIKCVKLVIILSRKCEKSHDEA